MSAGRIIIVEDDAELLETIAEYLELKGFEVARTDCALNFFQALVGTEYDVAVVDIGLPDKTGFEVVEHLRRNTSLGIIVLTARDSMSDKLRGYEAGADHYFTKPLDSRELSAAVSSLVGRLGRIPPAPAPPATGLWRLDPLRWTLATPTDEMVKLTEKEVGFLNLVISRNGDSVSRDTLLDALDYQTDDLYGSRALAVMVARLRKKIREQTGLEPPIKAIRSLGYSFSGPAVLA